MAPPLDIACANDCSRAKCNTNSDADSHADSRANRHANTNRDAAADRNTRVVTANSNKAANAGRADAINIRRTNHTYRYVLSCPHLLCERLADASQAGVCCKLSHVGFHLPVLSRWYIDLAEKPSPFNNLRLLQ
jgi:hypothetical protein